MLHTNANQWLFTLLQSVRLNKSVTEARKEYKDKDEMPLDDCLKLFTSTERLGPNDPWYVTTHHTTPVLLQKLNKWTFCRQVLPGV